jgi:hypothetical protein
MWFEFGQICAPSGGSLWKTMRTEDGFGKRRYGARGLRFQFHAFSYSSPAMLAGEEKLTVMFSKKCGWRPIARENVGDQRVLKMRNGFTLQKTSVSNSQKTYFFVIRPVKADDEKASLRPRDDHFYRAKRFCSVENI